MSEKKNVNLPILCVFLLIIITGAVGYLYYRVFFQMPRDITFCLTSHETLSYQLFDNQFSHILTTITILIAMFGLAIPLATYFFQQRNFRDDKAEINRIKDKFDQEFNAFRDMKCEFPKMQKDFFEFRDVFPKMQEEFEIFKSDFPEMKKEFNAIQKEIQDVKSKISDIYIASAVSFKNNLDNSCGLFAICLKKQPNNREYLSSLIFNILADENNILHCLLRAKNKNYLDINFLKSINEQIISQSVFQETLDRFLKHTPTEKDFISRQDLADWLGADSLEYKNLVAALSIFYDAYDKLSQDSSDA